MGTDVAGKLLEPGDDEDFTRLYTKEEYDAGAIDEQFEALIGQVNAEGDEEN